jgi:hypothetical protein
MQNKKNFKKIFLKLFLLLLVLGLGVFQDANAAGELRVTNTYRISHPAYGSPNLGKNALQPWNADKSRVMLYEGYNIANVPPYYPYSHPDFLEQRGIISTFLHPIIKLGWEQYNGTTTYRRKWKTATAYGIGIYWEPSEIRQSKNGWVPFTKHTSINNVVADDNSWFYDSVNDYLYIHTYNSDNPSSRTVQIMSEKRGLLWGCLTAQCLSDSAGNGKLGDGITKTLPDLNLSNISSGTVGERHQSLLDWDSNTVKMNFTKKSSDQYDRPHWSPYIGENNIIYALNRKSKMLVAYNVDTGIEKPIISYDPASYGKSLIASCDIDKNGVYNDPINLDSAQIYGFSKTANITNDSNKNKIVILLDWGCSDGEYGASYIIDIGRSGYWNYLSPSLVSSSSGEELWSYCGRSDYRSWYPKDQTIHSSGSPDGEYVVWDHNGPLVFKTRDRSNDTPYKIPPANVNLTVNTITLQSDPGWVVGEAVHYYADGGTPIGNLDSYVYAPPDNPNDYWIKTKVGNIITLSDTPEGSTVDLQSSTGNSNQYLWLAEPGSCHNYTKSLGRPTGLGILTMYTEEYWYEKIDNLITHPTWFGSNDSFMIASSPVRSKYPKIIPSNIYQYVFNRNTTIPANHEGVGIIPRTTLISKPSASFWHDPFYVFGDGRSDDGVNYGGGLASPSDSLDFTQIYFAATDGKYSLDDYAWCQAHPLEPICGNDPGDMGDIGWEGIGSYVAHLASGGGGDTTPPAVPMGVRVE